MWQKSDYLDVAKPPSFLIKNHVFGILGEWVTSFQAEYLRLVQKIEEFAWTSRHFFNGMLRKMLRPVGETWLSILERRMTHCGQHWSCPLPELLTSQVSSISHLGEKDSFRCCLSLIFLPSLIAALPPGLLQVPRGMCCDSLLLLQFMRMFRSCGESQYASSWFLRNPRWMAMLDVAANLECSPTVCNKGIAILEGLPILYSLHLYPPFPQVGLILNSVGHRSVVFRQRKYLSVVLWTSIDLLGLLISVASVYHFGPEYLTAIWWVIKFDDLDFPACRGICLSN